MRAVAVRKFREAPALMQLPNPKPGPNEVLVRLTAAGLNPFDWKIVDGIFEGKRPHVFPLVVGVDGAGTIEELGKDVSRFAVGDPVYGDFLHSPIGVGTYAEYVTAPAGISITRPPRSVNADRAAAVPLAGMAALVSVDTVGLSKGDTLLIVGATGGVGSFATQLAASRGIRVIATAGTDAAERVRSFGAAEIVDHHQGEVASQVRASHPNGVSGLIDLVSDAAGFSANASLVRKGGTAATTAFVADADSLRTRGVRGVNIDVHPTAGLLDRLTAEIEAGRLTIPVESEVPLVDAPAALSRSRARESRGKTVIII